MPAKRRSEGGLDQFISHIPLPQGPEPQPSAAHIALSLAALRPLATNAPDMSFLTGAAVGVRPTAIPARAHNSPQVSSRSAILCCTSSTRPFDSHKYS